MIKGNAEKQMSKLQHAVVKLILSFLQNDLIYSTSVSNWVILQAMKRYTRKQC